MLWKLSYSGWLKFHQIESPHLEKNMFAPNVPSCCNIDAFRYLVLINFTSMIYESRVVFLSKVGSLPVDLSVPWWMWQGARYLYRCKLQTRSTRLIYIISRRWNTPYGNRYDGHYRAVKLESITTSGIIKRERRKGFTNVRVKKPSGHPTKRFVSTPGWFFWHLSKESTENVKRRRHPNKRATMNK